MTQAEQVRAEVVRQAEAMGLRESDIETGLQDDHEAALEADGEDVRPGTSAILYFALAGYSAENILHVSGHDSSPSP